MYEVNFYFGLTWEKKNSHRSHNHMIKLVPFWQHPSCNIFEAALVVYVIIFRGGQNKLSIK